MSSISIPLQPVINNWYQTETSNIPSGIVSFFDKTIAVNHPFGYTSAQTFSSAIPTKPNTLQDWADQMGILFTILDSGEPTPILNPAYANLFKNAVIADFKIMVGSDGGDWSVIGGAPSDADVINWWNSFLPTLPSGLSATQILNAAAQQLSLKVKLKSASSVNLFLTQVTFPTVNPSVVPVTSPVLSYEDAYRALYPTATDAEVNSAIQAYHTQVLQTQNYFVPSLSYQGWLDFIKTTAVNAYNTFSEEFLANFTLPANPFSTTSLASMRADRTLVLNKIFALLAAILGSMQGIAAVQANRLLVLTNWQRVYTDMLNQQPIFLAGNPNSPSLDGDHGDAKQARSDMTTANQTFQARLTANRDAVSSDAKAVQSNINQSNDAVSQQANMATAIIQELTTLLGAIFR